MRVQTLLFVALPHPMHTRVLSQLRAFHAIKRLAWATLLLVPQLLPAQSNADWKEYKRVHNLPESLTYEQFLKQGGLNGFPGGGGLTSTQEQLATQTGAMIGQALGEALFGTPEGRARAAAEAAEQEKINLAASQYYKSGVWALQEKNYAMAADLFEKALAKRPGDKSIADSLAQAKRQLQQLNRNSETARKNNSLLGQTTNTLRAPAVAAAPDKSAQAEVSAKFAELLRSAPASPPAALGTNGGSAASSGSRPAPELNVEFEKLFGAPGGNPPAFSAAGENLRDSVADLPNEREVSGPLGTREVRTDATSIVRQPPGTRTGAGEQAMAAGTAAGEARADGNPIPLNNVFDGSNAVKTAGDLAKPSGFAGAPSELMTRINADPGVVSATNKLKELQATRYTLQTERDNLEAEMKRIRENKAFQAAREKYEAAKKKYDDMLAAVQDGEAAVAEAKNKAHRQFTLEEVDGANPPSGSNPPRRRPAEPPSPSRSR